MDGSNKQYRREQVVSIINSVIKKVEVTDVISRESLYAELQSLHQLIDELRKEVSNRPEEIREQHIPSATDELDAIVQATADATGSIMDSCEEIEKLGGEIGGDAGDKITAEITKIYEACSFQDITGQRVTKVVGTLKQIDEKVGRILDAFGPTSGGVPEEKAPVKETLVNGPQMPDKAISQDDIDKLLAEFD
jgi:chemotaxis protein CheZ